MIIPITVIILSRIFKKAPKKINKYSGYRTKLSMKNNETWEYAHKVAGRVWLKCGIIMFLASIVISTGSWFLNEDIMGYLCMLIVILQAIFLIFLKKPVERALNEKFDVNGDRRIQ